MSLQRGAASLRVILVKSWRLFALALLVVGVATVAIQVARAKAQKQREAAYQSLLRSYQETFRSGMTRHDVEAALRLSEKSFQQMCCMDGRRSTAFDDLTKIGEESAPWFCSAQNVYIGFEFDAVEPHDRFHADGSDKLTNVRIFRWLEGCL